jgi:aerobic-type carbon monoxide dehydrogenase small subunit (CoxS/CutS family)
MGDGTIEPMSVTMTVNRKPVTVEVEPSESLSYTLRNRVGLTGTKVSCDVQVCGACTVLVDGLPRSSCTYLTYEARGSEVLTVEGLALSENQLNPIQEAFLHENGFQCGFCTSGMLMSAQAFLTSEPETDDEALIDYMSGNLCRCTGYLSIVAAMLRAQGSLTAGRARE